MNIDELTLGQIKQIHALLGVTQGPIKPEYSAFEIGKNYFIRTATYHVVGKLKAIFSNELVLSDAAWVADSGRFHEALKTGELNEVEPFEDDAIVSRGGIIDATRWAHTLPREVK